jgi:hypothetical protein
MVSRSALRRSQAIVLAIAGFAVSVPVSFALTETEPLKTCRWDGTAPWCRGECEPDEVANDRTGDADRAQFAGFGESCVAGVKVFCCTLRCPDGFHLVRVGSGSSRTCVAETGMPVGPQVITLPEGPVLLKKGPYTAPDRAMVLKKDLPVAAPEPTPPAPPGPTVTVLLPVQVYDTPDDPKKVIGELAAGTPGVILAEPCRADHWCHVKWGPPGREGWVWSGPGYKSLNV